MSVYSEDLLSVDQIVDLIVGGAFTPIRTNEYVWDFFPGAERNDLHYVDGDGEVYWISSDPHHRNTNRGSVFVETWNDIDPVLTYIDRGQWVSMTI